MLIADGCYDLPHAGATFSWAGRFWPAPGQSWPGQYFLHIFTKNNSIDLIFCVLLTLILLEVETEYWISYPGLKNTTILQWFIHRPGQNWPALYWWGLKQWINLVLSEYLCNTGRAAKPDYWTLNFWNMNHIWFLLRNEFESWRNVHLWEQAHLCFTLKS